MTATDTNILLRLAHPEHPMHAPAEKAVQQLLIAGETLCYLPQNIREFWNACTQRIERNGLGWTHAQTEIEVQRIEAAFKLVSDGTDIYHEWRRMVLQYQVSGVQVHDCYIAAAVKARGIDSLLTFNTSDFKRYGITIIDPADA